MIKINYWYTINGEYPDEDIFANECDFMQSFPVFQSIDFSPINVPESREQFPISFEFFQSFVEIMMYQLQQAIDGCVDPYQLKLIKDDFQRKILIHQERGEWYYGKSKR